MSDLVTDRRVLELAASKTPHVRWAQFYGFSGAAAARLAREGALTSRRMAGPLGGVEYQITAAGRKVLAKLRRAAA